MKKPNHILKSGKLSKSYCQSRGTYENLAICAVDQGKTDEAIGFFELG